ncbi:DNA internalization-related competence protein ComEC/Rec2 [Thiothrix nivea]|uniref:DNA internalization-related competence protein ComEC/Rec2 n=1 Tax=Thiothrix nivea (strain ATCC 35100 / DSM 5205 / JP2) TaxID=870187 RepID=A0A656HGY1_THINJ|nr:DNA internalization-related competence protein ComEC/Rec2 [Thiothrix nivea]EIJ36168.1 DNA internalization-related competence protein ComEC/Rec2 [Thiothrix nivea DSM 5205]
MRSFAVSFLVGTLVLWVLPRLPEMRVLFWGMVAMALGMLASMAVFRLPLCLRLPATLVSALLLGACYTIWTASGVKADWLPQAWEGQDVLLTGTVADVPERRADGLRFLLDVEQADRGDYHGRLRLAWYEDALPDIRAGDRWQLLVRGKRPNGFMNPGSFDYEQWLFSQRIGGSGYVRKSGQNQRVSHGLAFSPNAIRQRVQERIQTALGDSPETGLVQGLAVAYRSTISPQQWETLRKTGTSHLLAISGLHIGMVAGFGFLPVMLVWRLFPTLYTRMPVRVAGGIVGGVFACAYALLAGFTIPTQRALVMVLVLMLGLLWRRQIPFSITLALALLLVVLIDPLASLSAGFWLSFGAVSLLAWLGMRRHRQGKMAFLWVQLALSLGMLPLTAGFFGSVSLVSPLANLLAIPYVTVLVVPLILLGVLLTGILPGVAAWVWQAAALLLQGLMMGLDWLATFSLSSLYLPLVPLPWLLLALAGFTLLWLPRGMPGRWLGMALMLPLALFQPEKPEPGAFRLSVLDVGQGLASVVQTANHTLVFDTGPRVSDSFDSGELVVLPWLYGQGVRQLDTLVVSHADNDHSGGAKAILAAMPVAKVLVNAADVLTDHQTNLCLSGQSWHWDGVEFTMVHPSGNFPEQKENNRSCVLKIANQYHSVLLAADIERPAEQWLVKQDADLRADVLLLPHHGSKTSSSPAFIKTVSPQLGIVTSGYLNRFHHPHPSVVRRYEAYDVKLLDTVESGELRLDFPVTDAPWRLREWRKAQLHVWNRSLEK